MASTDPSSSNPVRKFFDSNTGVFWDVHDYPIFDQLDPVSIKQKITDAVCADGYTGDVSIHLCVGKNKFPDHLVETYSNVGIQITFSPEDDDVGMLDKMIVGIVLWAFENTQPANVILLSKFLGNGTVNGLETLHEIGYYILVSDPPKELKSHPPKELKSLPCENFSWLLKSVSDPTDYHNKRKREDDSEDLLVQG